MNSNQTERKRRKWLWVGGAVMVMVCLAAVFMVVRLRGAMAAQVSQVSTGEIVTVTVGDLSSSASASGRVAAQREAQLALTGGGMVAEVNVEAGDSVQAGEVLLRLETAELERAVASAEQAVIIQEANLADLQTPPSAAEMASAEAAVANAEAALADLLDGPSPAEIASAEADVQAAQADVAAAYARLNNSQGNGTEAEIQAAQYDLEQAQMAATQAAEQHSTILATEPGGFLSADQLAEIELSARAAAVQANAQLTAAQEALDALLNGDSGSVASASAGVAVAAAQRDAAQARLDLLLQPATAAQIASAEANVAQAEASVDRLLAGPAESQVVMAEIQLENARLSLQRAQNNLTAAALVAPFDGVVTAVHARPGEQAAGVVVEMVDSGSLEVVLDMDEVDIGDIAVGQAAVVTLEAWPDEEISSEVTAIAPSATQTPGSTLVTYAVYLSVAETERPVRIGMTANASLETARRDDVLLAPNAAIQADRSNGTYSVNLVERDAQGNPTYESVPVTIGLRDNRFTQIVSGVEEGDELLVGAITADSPFGPGNGPGGE
jgi:HlyD family secretion protein